MLFLHFLFIFVVLLTGKCCHGWWFEEKSVCYGTFGCFNTSYPFNNADDFLPQDPDGMDLGFRVFFFNSRSARLTWDVSASQLIDFINPDFPVKILIHGYQDHGRTPWIIKMVSEFRRSTEPLNLLSLDWEVASSTALYSQVVANIRLVSILAGQFIKALINLGVQPRYIHLIGHSLGAHLSGAIGTVLLNDDLQIFRITGLDPAAPLFENTHPLVRLDESDAMFVDVVHSSTEPVFYVGSGIRIGIKERSGTVDFYPNTGRYQPGCPVSMTARFLDFILRNPLSGASTSSMWKALKWSFGCSHLRALDLYRESINSGCNYNMYFCWSAKNISKPECVPCSNMHCPLFGYRAVDHGFPGVFYFNTEPESPFCLH